MGLDLTRNQIVEYANEILDEYRADNLDLTLRQMYYQFVARGLLDSGQEVYKRIGDTLTDARYDGRFPVDGLLDRGRDVHAGDFTRLDSLLDDTVRRSATQLVGAIPSLLIQAAKWAGQETFVSVWVEKEALAGIFERTCNELGVSWFACKGYPSVSSLWDWLRIAGDACNPEPRHVRFRWPGNAVVAERREGCAERAVVLYFGDHDPDGWEIPRSAERNLRRLMQLPDAPKIDVTFERVALLRSQIDQYNPPPFEAKVTSARYQGYVEEHATEEAWELDALEPRVLRDLIRRNVSDYFDAETHAELQDNAFDLRRRLTMEMQTTIVERAFKAADTDRPTPPPSFDTDLD